MRKVLAKWKFESDLIVSIPLKSIERTSILDSRRLGKIPAPVPSGKYAA
jgi:hypothetical protein